MEAQREKAASLSPRQAAQAFIDAGGMFILNHETKDKGGNLVVKPKCWWRHPKGMLKAEKTDSTRRIVRFHETEHRPFTADEVSEWQESGNPRNRAGLIPYTAGMMVVDFDSGSLDDQQSWIRAMGDPVCVLRSRSGRGLHAWFRRPKSAEWADLRKMGFVLPALKGDEPVRGDFIPCNGQGIIRDSDSLVRLAEAWQKPGGTMAFHTMKAIYGCVEGGALSLALSELRDTESGHHHVAFMRVAGRLFGTDFKGHEADGFVFRALLSIADLWDLTTRADSERGLLYITEKRDEERLARFQAYKDARDAAGLSVESVDIDGPSGRGDVFDVSHDGVLGMFACEGWRLGENRRGRKRLLIDTGKGWKDLAGPSMEYVLGSLRRHYLRPTADDDKPRPWFVSSAREMNAILREAASGVQVDPFKDYLDSLPEVAWDDDAKARLMSMPTRLWKFGSDDELVGLAFRYSMCGAVARCYEPGVKHDSVLVLQGDQKLGKSSFMRNMLPEAIRHLSVRVSLKSLGDNDGYKKLVEKINGMVFAELSEMKSTGPRLAEDIKDFISAQEDTVRMAYDSDVVRLPRDVIFIGTANDPEPLYADPSGNRRFHVLALSGFATPEIEGDLDGIERLLDGGMRDEWWSLAKACWKGMGIDSHRPSGEESEIFSINEEEFEKTGGLDADVDMLLDGLRFADDESEWAVSFLSARLVSDALGLTDPMKGNDRPNPQAAGSLKIAMQRRGWRRDNKRVLVGDIEKRMAVFFPDTGTWPRGGPYPVYDEAQQKRLLERAIDRGVPLTAGDMEAEAVKASEGWAGDDAEVPF